MSNILAERAMLARLSISQWSARKLDRKVTDEINKSHNAAADAGRYNKLLVSKDAIAKLQAIAGAARIEHITRTLPWSNEGQRILSSIGYMDYAAKMQEYRREFETAVDSFCAGYEDFVIDARTRLNGLFDENDYPSTDQIRNKFRFGVVYDPCPTANDFRVDMSAAQADMIRADIESRLNEAMTIATRDIYQRIAETVGHMVEKLRAYKPRRGKSRAEGTFHDSLVTNVQDLIELMPSLNISGDKALSKLAKQMSQDLCGESADSLRENSAVRESVASAAESILETVSDFLA